MPIKVLIIDDSMVARMGIKKCIPKEGYVIYEAKDGQKGLSMFKEINPDITFLDLTMPIMDGPEALGHMKAHDSNATIVIMSADTQQRTREKVLSLGASAKLKKPPVQDEILEQLASLETA